MSYELGAVASSPLAAATQVANDIIGISNRVRQVASDAVKNQGVFSQAASLFEVGGSVKEWAQTLVLQVDGMCARATKIDRSGAPAWARNPALITVIADYVEQAAKEQKDNTAELATAAGLLRDCAQRATAIASKVLEAAAKGLLDGLKAADPAGATALVVVGVLAAAIAVAYVVRAFK